MSITLLFTLNEIFCTLQVQYVQQSPESCWNPQVYPCPPSSWGPGHLRHTWTESPNKHNHLWFVISSQHMIYLSYYYILSEMYIITPAHIIFSFQLSFNIPSPLILFCYCVIFFMKDYHYFFFLLAYNNNTYLTSHRKFCHVTYKWYWWKFWIIQVGMANIWKILYFKLQYEIVTSVLCYVYCVRLFPVYFFIL